MADPRPEPSMEEILASIKRIIADDSPAPPPRVAMPPWAAPEPPVAAPVPPRAVMPERSIDWPAERPLSRPPIPARDEDSILELTDIAPRRSYEMREIPAAPPAMTGGGTTVEAMVRELLRPMLSQWIDAHLPAVVERLVQQEIDRMSDDKR